MARRKHPIVHIGIPPQRDGRPGQINGVVVPRGSVALYSSDIIVIALLGTDGVKPTGGGPRHDVNERVLRTSVPEYKGNDPLRLTVPMIFDGWRGRRNVKPDIDALYKLAHLKAGESQTPTLRLAGPVPFTDRRWAIDGTIDWDDTPEPIRDHEGVLLRQAVTVSLLERVPDSLLHTSIVKSRRSGKGARNGPHYTVVKAGENDLGDVSKRLYGTRARKRDLAQANGLAVGARLRRHQRIRVP